MKQLVKRYITRKQQRNLNSGVTEDDINEIKQDISGLRYQNFILNQYIQNRYLAIFIFIVDSNY